MNSYKTDGETVDTNIFTGKQCCVLDLLIEHKTSKEIARELGISPHTVDQRISLARTRLGVSSRNELAARYRVMRDAPGHSSAEDFASSAPEHPEPAERAAPDTPSIFPVTGNPPGNQADAPGDYLLSPAPPSPDKILCPTSDDVEYRVGPEVFEGSSGVLWRLGAIVATALFLVITILGLFAIFNQITAMFD